MKAFCIEEYYEPPHDKTNKMTCAPNEDSDQPGHQPRLIWIFAGRICHCIGFVRRRLLYHCIFYVIFSVATTSLQHHFNKEVNKTLARKSHDLGLTRYVNPGPYTDFWKRRCKFKDFYKGGGGLELQAKFNY